MNNSQNTTKTCKNPRKISKFLLSLFTIIGLSLAIPLSGLVAANTFTYDYTTTYTVNTTQSIVQIRQEVLIKSLSQIYKISEGSEWEFIIPIQRDPEKIDDMISEISPTIKVSTSSGSSVTYRTQKDTASLSVFATIPRDINPYSSLTLVLSYSTPELYEKVGKVTNIYIPGLDSETELENTDAETQVTHKTTFISKIKIPKNMPDPSLTTLVPNRSYTEGNYKIIEYTGKQLVGNSVWIQFGKSQIYKFRISQKPVTRDVSDVEKFLSLSQNEYVLIIPADADHSNQNVVFTQITPEPYEVNITEEGNLQAKFKLEANYKSDIVVKGYIMIDHTDKDNDYDRTGTFKDIPEHLKYLTEPATYWESDEQEITEKADELKGKSQNVLEVVEATYEFVINSIDYDDKYVYGKPHDRKGALATLKGAESVCMEYSDLFIALSRAQGIPSRAAFGSGYDPNMPADQQVGHQWAQVWIPKIGWLTVDTTWGESGRDFIGYDVDHALWLVREENPETPSEVELIAHSDVDSLEAPHSFFTPVENVDPADEDLLMSQSEILEKYKALSGEIRLDASIFEFLELIPGYRIMVIVIPAIILILVVSTILSIFKRLKQKTDYEKNRELKKATEKIEEQKQATVLKQVTNVEAQEKIRKTVTQKKYDLSEPFGAAAKLQSPSKAPSQEPPTPTPTPTQS